MAQSKFNTRPCVQNKNELWLCLTGDTRRIGNLPFGFNERERISLCFKLNKNTLELKKKIGAAGGRAGLLLCVLLGGRSLKWWNFTGPNPVNFSRAPILEPAYLCTPLQYRQYTFCASTQVWTNFSVRCAFPMVPSWSCVNILSLCQTKCVRNVKRSNS